MLNLEDFMNIRDLKQQGWSVTAIADELHLDRKTVRKHLLDAPQPYKRENPAPCKIDPHRPFQQRKIHRQRRDFPPRLVELTNIGPGAERLHLPEQFGHGRVPSGRAAAGHLRLGSRRGGQHERECGQNARSL